MRTPNNGPEYDHPARDGALKTYVICSTPRSGSTLLARALWDSGVAGAPKEYFNYIHRDDFVERWGPMDTPAYVDGLLRHRTSPNGVFGLKAHFNQWQQDVLAHGLDPDELFPDLHCLFITRGDRLRQAISLAKAMETGQWNIQGEGEVRAARYDFDAIGRYRGAIEQEERMWHKWFERTGRAPVTVTYEELSGDYEATVRRVLDGLGIDSAGVEIPPSRLKVLRNAETEEWVERYERDAAAR